MKIKNQNRPPCVAKLSILRAETARQQQKSDFFEEEIRMAEFIGFSYAWIQFYELDYVA